jgi:hypothetical protein
MRLWVETYRNELLPDLQKSLDATQKLFAAGDPSVDVLRILDVRRKVLKARDGYLDALYELRQAQDDLSAAVGDLTLAMDPKPEMPSQCWRWDTPGRNCHRRDVTCFHRGAVSPEH